MAIKIQNVTVIDDVRDMPTGGIINITHTGALTTGGNTTINGVNFLKVPVGTTAQRPGQAAQPAVATGQIRFNSSLVSFEGYDGTSWGDLGSSAALHLLYVDSNGNLDYTLYNKNSSNQVFNLIDTDDRDYVANFISANKSLISISSGQLRVEIVG
jgi:hypothetical protein